MHERTRGFTLIELIIVITIVAILAAVALPRFIDAQRDARQAKANAIFGSIRSAAALAKARCELDLVAVSTPSATNCKTDGTGSVSVLMDGALVAMVYGYPEASPEGIGTAAQINPAADGLTPHTSGTAIYYDVVGGTTTQCSINYAPATLSGTGVGAIQIAPIISVNTSAC